MMKAGIITQARMNSYRLYGKVIKSIADKPLIGYHIERLQKSGVPIYLATTDLPEDDILLKVARDFGISVFRGSSKDVLKRFYDCARHFDLDVIIRVTADCPLIDGFLIKKSLQEYLKAKDQRLYMSPCLHRTLPRGLDFEIFSKELLEEAHLNGDREMDREHVTTYMYRPKRADINLAHIAQERDYSKWRLCVDVIQDFQLIEKLILDYGIDKFFSQQLLTSLDKCDNLQNINQSISQVSIDSDRLK